MIDAENNVAHYTKFENLKNILEKKTIRLSFTKNFDDPRENSLDWISTLGYGTHVDIEQQNIAKKLKTKAGSQINIFCTCKSNNKTPESCPIESSSYGKPRMWSQYGGNSKGFCLVFDKDKLNEQIQLLAEQPEYLISDNIIYYEWLHHVGGGSTIEYGDGIDLTKTNIFDILNHNRMLHSIYFKKNSDWKDENEFRWLLFSSKGQPIDVSITNCVKAVVLGCEFPLEQHSLASAYSKDLKCSCYALQYHHPKYQMYEL